MINLETSAGRAIPNTVKILILLGEQPGLTNAQIKEALDLDKRKLHTALWHIKSKEWVRELLGERQVTDKGRAHMAKAFVPKTESKPKPEGPDQTAMRTCLYGGCGKTFRSSWPGERVCKSCREHRAWREGVWGQFA